MRQNLLTFVLTLTLAATAAAQTLVGSGFSYQGRLDFSGEPVNDTYDFEFMLWDADTNGNMIGSVLAVDAVAVVDGLITVELDFGVMAFNGDARWLEIALRESAGGGAFTALSPRQPLTAAPYALQALNATNAWALGGNAGTDPNTNFLGTTDQQPLELRVNGERALRLEPTQFVGGQVAGNLIGGSSANEVASGSINATVFGGTESLPNRVGENNNDATISGGLGNTIEGGGSQQTIGGGSSNTVRSTIGGIGAAVIAGGIGNLADGDASAVTGGRFNVAENNFAAVGGGFFNRATGEYATIPGGRSNAADGAHSFAAGREAEAQHDGAFVWSSSDEVFASTAADQFLIDATGGVGIGTNTPSSELEVAGTITASAFIGDGSGLTSLPSAIQTENFVHYGPNQLDQSNEVINLTSNGGWQSFTAGTTGALHTISILVHATNQTPSVELTVQAGAGPGGPVLSQEILSVPVGATQWVDLPIANTPLLQAGEQYTFTVDGPGSVWVGQANGNPYSGGRASSSPFRDLTFRTFVYAAGSVGINRTAVANALEVGGDASKSTAGDWLANSDRRIKTDIQTIDNALDTLDRVRLVSFAYTDDYKAKHAGVSDGRYLNVIAQEFAQVFPDHVKGSGERLPDGSEILQVDTYPLTIYSAAAIQELRAEKDAEIAVLKNRLERLEALLEASAQR